MRTPSAYTGARTHTRTWHHTFIYSYGIYLCLWWHIISQWWWCARQPQCIHDVLWLLYDSVILTNMGVRGKPTAMHHHIISIGRRCPMESTNKAAKSTRVAFIRDGSGEGMRCAEAINERWVMISYILCDVRKGALWGSIPTVYTWMTISRERLIWGFYKRSTTGWGKTDYSFCNE